MMPRRRRTAVFAAWFLACLVFAMAAVALLPSKAQAHPLGNFTINHHSTVEFSEGEARVNYVLDFAEIPTVQMKPDLDTDGDGELSEAEADAYLDDELPNLMEGIQLEVGGEALALESRRASAEFVPGEAGLPTLRIEADLAADLPGGWEDEGSGAFTLRNYEDRLGWREVVVRGGPGVAIEDASAPERSVSDELRSYPEDMLLTPLDVREAEFTLVPGDGSLPEAAGNVEGGGAAADRLSALVSTENLSPGIVGIALLSALLWGAAHALTPGHGKAVVAAYLVGSRGTLLHAGFLGLTVTVTHTAGVFALGAATLYLSRYFLPETLYPWLSVLSGVLVVAVGLFLLFNHLKKRAADAEHAHSHDHGHPHSHDDGRHTHSLDDGHSHDHGHMHSRGHMHSHGHAHLHGGRSHSHMPPGADGSRVGVGSLLALGVTGGLVPCPAALVLLLGAVSLGRLEFGLALVVAFSLGLAVVLIAIGAVMIYARPLFERFSFEAKTPRLLPIASASAISLVGAAILLSAIRQTGLL